MATDTGLTARNKALPEAVASKVNNLSRRLVVAVAAILCSWFVVTVGITNVTRASNPALAIWWSPTDTRALSNLADRLLLESQSPETLKQAVSLARIAIKRDATNVVAMRTLGLSQKIDKQERYFRYANRLSRRDLATQLWLIEHEVTNGNARAALVHYDAALRTSELAPAMLFPILTSASGDQDLAPEIGKMLAKKPIWAAAFLYGLVEGSPSPNTLMMILETVRKSSDSLPEGLDGNLMRRLVRDFRFDLLPRAYLMSGGKNRQIGKDVSNGQFSAEPTHLPLDWAFSDVETMSVDRSLADDSRTNYRMVVQADDGVVGEAVRQMVLLEPGQYSLTLKAGNIPPISDAKLTWRILCADTSSTEIGATILRPSNSGGQVNRVDFTVPSENCSAQWLALRVITETDGEGVDAWFDNAAIRKSQLGG